MSLLSSLCLSRGFGSFFTPSFEDLLSLTADQLDSLFPSTLSDEDIDQHQHQHDRQERFVELFPLVSGGSEWSKWTFLNHGAFGLSLSSLLRVQHEWTMRMERQPTHFYDRVLLPALARVTIEMRSFVRADDKLCNVIMVPNVTTALSCVFRSLVLSVASTSTSTETNAKTETEIATRAPSTTTTLVNDASAPADLGVESKAEQQSSNVADGEEVSTLLGPQATVLSLSLAYGSVKKMIVDLCARTKTHSLVLDVKFPFSAQKLLQEIEENIAFQAEHGQPITIAVFDHITSNTALMLPVVDLVTICQRHNIFSIIDGAHALFHVDLSFETFKPDVYSSNLHKWLCNPKGAAFLYLSPRAQSLPLEPPVISHGYKSGLNSEWSWLGTCNYSSILTALNCLKIWSRPQALLGFSLRELRNRNADLCRWACKTLCTRFNTHSYMLRADDSAESNDLCMTCVPLSILPRASLTGDQLQQRLYDKQIECPIKTIEHRFYARISCHVYNEPQQYIALADALDVIQAELAGASQVVSNDSK